MRGARAQPGTCLQAQRSAGSPRLSLPSPLFAMHSRSLCPGNTEVHPALLSHCPVHLFPLTASSVSGSPPPPISSLRSSILTRPSSRCDLLISHVLMLSHPCLCQRQATLGPGICSDGPELAHCGHISVTAQPAWLLLRDAAPAPRTEEWTQFPPSLQLQIPALLQAQAGSVRARRQRSSPSHQQPSPKKAKHRLCLHLSLHSQAVNADCRSPFRGSDSRKALQDGINPFCTGAE